MFLNNKRGKDSRQAGMTGVAGMTAGGFTPLEKADDGAGGVRLMNNVRGRGSLTGFTLVEVMVAMVLSLIIFLALMQTSLISMEHNTRNALRDEAVGIAGMRMEDARNLSFTNLVDDTDSLAGADCPSGFSATGVLVERNVRSITGFDFCTNREVDIIDSGTRRVTITVGWRWKGQGFTHAVSTVMRG